VVKIQVQVFWVVMPCNAVVGQQHFWGPCCVHLWGEMTMEAARSSETLVSYNTVQCHNPRDLDLAWSTFLLTPPPPVRICNCTVPHDLEFWTWVSVSCLVTSPWRQRESGSPEIQQHRVITHEWIWLKTNKTESLESYEMDLKWLICICFKGGPWRSPVTYLYNIRQTLFLLFKLKLSKCLQFQKFRLQSNLHFSQNLLLVI
jgi:hypothetical protein